MGAACGKPTDGLLTGASIVDLSNHGLTTTAFLKGHEEIVDLNLY